MPDGAIRCGSKGPCQPDLLVANLDTLMACSVSFDDFEYEDLVVGHGELGQREDGSLALMGTYDTQVVAYAQQFEWRYLLCRSLCDLAVLDPKCRSSTSKEMLELLYSDRWMYITSLRT